jgi:hypothetical protein
MLLPQLGVVVNFSIENNAVPSIEGHGLRATADVEDRKPQVAERDVVLCKTVLLIRTAMAHYTLYRVVVEVEIYSAGDSAHLMKKLLWQNKFILLNAA